MSELMIQLNILDNEDEIAPTRLFIQKLSWHFSPYARFGLKIKIPNYWVHHLQNMTFEPESWIDDKVFLNWQELISPIEIENPTIIDIKWHPKCRAPNFNSYNLDDYTTTQASYNWIRLCSDISELYFSIAANCKFSRPTQTDIAYIIGPGAISLPITSEHQACTSHTMVVASAWYKLFDSSHIQPQSIVTTDALSLFGPATSCTKRRSIILDTLKRGVYLYTSDIIRNNLKPFCSLGQFNHIIGLPFISDKPPSSAALAYPIGLPDTHNVLTSAAIPFAQSIAQNITLIGFDGHVRDPKSWAHNGQNDYYQHISHIRLTYPHSGLQKNYHEAHIRLTSSVLNHLIDHGYKIDAPGHLLSATHLDNKSTGRENTLRPIYNALSSIHDKPLTTSLLFAILAGGFTKLSTFFIPPHILIILIASIFTLAFSLLLIHLRIRQSRIIEEAQYQINSSLTDQLSIMNTRLEILENKLSCQNKSEKE